MLKDFDLLKDYIRKTLNAEPNDNLDDLVCSLTVARMRFNAIRLRNLEKEVEFRKNEATIYFLSNDMTMPCGHKNRFQHPRDEKICVACEYEKNGGLPLSRQVSLVYTPSKEPFKKHKTYDWSGEVYGGDPERGLVHD